MNEKEFHSKLEADFYAYLKSLGYPDGSLISEPLIKVEDRIFAPDFLIVDPENNERLAIIEVKGGVHKPLDSVKEQLNSYKSAIGDGSLPVFLVTPNAQYVAERPFDIYKFNDGSDFEKIDHRLFPTFAALSTSKAVNRKKELSDKKEEVGNSFVAISLWMATALVGLVIADFICSFYKVTLLTTERLTLLGGAVVLIVIPYAQKFKGLGIEWEKAAAKKEKEQHP